jgi:predicted aspartyl protease
MVDSGASGIGFIDPRFAAKCKATVRPTQRHVTLADGSVVQAVGEATISYSLAAKSGAPLRFTSTFIVTPLDPYDIILGIGWLELHQVHVAFHERSMKVSIDGVGESRAIRVVERLADDGTPALAPLRLSALTERGFQRAMRKGMIEQVCAVFVRP